MLVENIHVPASPAADNRQHHLVVGEGNYQACPSATKYTPSSESSDATSRAYRKAPGEDKD